MYVNFWEGGREDVLQCLKSTVGGKSFFFSELLLRNNLVVFLSLCGILKINGQSKTKQTTTKKSLKKTPEQTNSGI